MRIGLIGYGGFGRFLHQSWDALDGPAVTAVADAVRPDGLPGGVAFYPGGEALIAGADVNLVAIATPPSTHAPLALAALARGRDVLVEKPVALSLGDVGEIRRAAQASGRVVAVDYMQRFTPVAEALAAWAESGAFGRLTRVVVENYAQDEALPRGHWFWDEAVSGGILVEHAVHFIDLAHSLLAPGDAAVEVQGGAVARADGRVDRVWMSAAYASGFVASHFHAFNRPRLFEETTVRFVFERAEVHADGWLPMAGRVRALVRGADDEAMLARLPGLVVDERTDLPPRPLSVGGRAFGAARDVRARFADPRPKPLVYADALRALLADVRAAGQRPEHRLRAGLDEAERSLAVALRARRLARTEGPG